MDPFGFRSQAKHHPEKIFLSRNGDHPLSSQGSGNLPEDTVYDVIVIGAGIMGIWTGLFALHRGKSCLILEQFPFPHTRGSSAGQSRIFRTAYPTDHQTLLAKDSLHFWQQLEEMTGRRLVLSYPFLRLTEVPDDKIVQACVSSMNRCKCSKDKNNKGSRFSISSGAEIMQQFPGLRFNSRARAVVDTNGRILMADRCLHTAKCLYSKMGGHFTDSTPVKHVQPGTVVSVTAQSGKVFKGRTLAICCGPWTNRILDTLDLHLPLVPVKVPTIYYRRLPDAPKTPDFSFLGNCHEFGEIYALPELEYRGMIKVGPHYGPVVDPDARDAVDMTEIIAFVSSYVKEHFTFVDPNPAIIENCMYTTTPDSDCIIDLHPKFSNIGFACGFCGAGYKISPMVGKIMIDLLTGNRAALPAYIGNHMSCRRFLGADARRTKEGEAKYGQGKTRQY